jgi:hypothetical protein|tara:strand:- start:258 stop:581 length:324 start_codon:yes stop_codon:yes gene_type:complete
MVKVIDAILAINPSAKVVTRGSDIDTIEIEWHNGTAEISKADIQAKMVELQAEYDAEVWKRNRQAEYPPIGDQLDMLWHSIDENAELKQKYFKFYEACKAIKVKYPK